MTFRVCALSSLFLLSKFLVSLPAGTEAQIECSRLISEISGGAYIEPDKITVREFLDRWLEHIKPQVSPRTHERYGEIVRKNLNPLLGVNVPHFSKPDA
ncbi:MAG: hypothetical protein ACM3IH_15225 [Sphingobacteriales bacterium]